MRLEPLTPAHGPALATAVTDGRLWELWYTAVPEPDKVASYVADALPMLITYYAIEHTGARRGVTAFGDINGGQHFSRPYGSHSRNAHLWDVQ